MAQKQETGCRPTYRHDMTRAHSFFTPHASSIVTAQTHQLAGKPGIPDSTLAWRMAAAAFVAGFVVFGIVYSFGVFLEPMTKEFPIGRAAT
jgi:hypothetical protein